MERFSSATNFQLGGLLCPWSHCEKGLWIAIGHHTEATLSCLDLVASMKPVCQYNDVSDWLLRVTWDKRYSNLCLAKHVFFINDNYHAKKL